VISIRTILVKRKAGKAAFAAGRFGRIRADYSGRGPNCNAAQTPDLARLREASRPDKAAQSGT